MHIPKGSTALVTVQATSFCNIDCTYCYLPSRTSRHVMDLGVLEKVLIHIADDELVASGFELLWHSGEPLAAGKDFFRRALSLSARLLQGKLGIQTIQTNGILLDDEWCALIKAKHVAIGISIDGPATIHDRSRVYRSGKGSHRDVMRAVDLLRKHGIDFYAICVLTDASLKHADEVLGFFQDNGIDRVCFNVEETEGTNISKTIALSSFLPGLAVFYKKALAVSRGRVGEGIWIREIADTFAQLQASAFGPVESQTIEPFRCLSIDCRGNWSTFCPELMGTKHERFGTFVFGNLAETPLRASPLPDSFRTIVSDIARGKQLCRDQCDYFSVCGGGRPANKFGEHGRFDVSETRQCAATIKTLTDVCLGFLETSMQASQTATCEVERRGARQP